MGCSPPGSSVRGILQARVLEWVAIPFSKSLPNPVSCIAGRLFTIWATTEAPSYIWSITLVQIQNFILLIPPLPPTPEIIETSFLDPRLDRTLDVWANQPASLVRAVFMLF